MPTAPAVTAVVVASFEDPAVPARTVRTLTEQTVPPAEILLVDNHPEAVHARAAAAAGLPVRALRPGGNLGYPQACNFAARHATGDWLFFVNPDAVADPDCLERLLEAADRDVAIVGAQVLLPDGETVNAGDNPVHLSGLSWSGRYLERREDGPPRDVACASGAALIARTSVYRALGGHCPAFFLYHDDVDMAWRARMAGWRVVFCPRARIRHDYEFDKGTRKWFFLEHNRAWTVLANHSALALVLLAPLLAAVEAATALQARGGGWWPEKQRAWREVARAWRALGRWRRWVQRHRRVPDAEVLALHTGSMDTPLLRSPLLDRVNPWVERYRAAVLTVLRMVGR